MRTQGGGQVVAVVALLLIKLVGELVLEGLENLEKIYADFFEVVEVTLTNARHNEEYCEVYVKW